MDRRQMLTLSAASFASASSPAAAGSPAPRTKAPGAGVLVTGAAGRIGSAVMRAMPDATPMIHTKDSPDHPNARRVDLATTVPDFSGFHTVIHYAGILKEDIETAAYNSLISFNVLRACRAAGVSRLIWASSLLAEGERFGFPATYYSREKLAQEAILVGYCGEDASRVAVAMRYGHFDIASHPPVANEAVRLDEPTLAYWIDRAFQAPAGLSKWFVLGRAPAGGYDRA